MPEETAELSLEEIEARVRGFTPDPARPHDRWGLVAVEEALAAARAGNGAIGAVLVDPAGCEVVRAHNEVFKPYFRSDMHAEMNVVSQFEAQRQNAGPSSGYTLFTSLLPCPMCIIRFAFAGIDQVYYLAGDAEGSAERTIAGFPPVWAGLAGQVQFAQAGCSPELIALAEQAWFTTLRLRRIAMSQA